MPLPLMEALLPANLEDAGAAGAVRRDAPAPAAAVPGNFRGMLDDDLRGSRLPVAPPPDVASSTAVAAVFTAASAAAAAFARLAANPLPPIVARRFSRPARPPPAAPSLALERLDEALCGDTPLLGLARAAAAAAAMSTATAPLPRPLSKLSSLSAPPPPPSPLAPALSLTVRDRAAPREGRGEVDAEEEGRGDNDLLAGCG